MQREHRQVGTIHSLLLLQPQLLLDDSVVSHAQGGGLVDEEAVLAQQQLRQSRAPRGEGDEGVLHGFHFDGSEQFLRGAGEAKVSEFKVRGGGAQ